MLKYYAKSKFYVFETVQKNHMNISILTNFITMLTFYIKKYSYDIFMLKYYVKSKFYMFTMVKKKNIWISMKQYSYTDVIMLCYVHIHKILLVLKYYINLKFYIIIIIVVIMIKIKFFFSIKIEEEDVNRSENSFLTRVNRG